MVELRHATDARRSLRFEFLVVAAFLSVSVLTSSQDDLPALVKLVEPSVLVVQTYKASGQRLAQGSAFFVSADGRVATNRHVVAGSIRAEVKAPDGSTFAIRAVVAEDRARDWVILSLDIPPGIARPLSIAHSLPEVGERVVVIGSPLGLEQTATDGIVSAVRSVKPRGKVIQMSAPISPGSSGSPVVNMRGQVVGIASFLRQNGQNLNFAVPAMDLPSLATGPERPLAVLAEALRPAEPDSAEQIYLRGVALLARREFAKALPVFESAVRVRPAYAEAYLHIGACLESMGRGRDALDAYRSAVLLRPEVSDFQERLGLALERQGQSREAMEAYDQAARLSPDNASALLGLARVYAKTGRVGESLAACQQAARLRPDLEEAYKLMGEAYAQQGRHPQAAEAFKQAIRLSPDDAAAHCGMGAALSAMGRSRDAAMAFKEAIRLSPDGAPGHYGLGRVALAEGNRGQALEEYKILKRLDAVLAGELFEDIY